MPIYVMIFWERTNRDSTTFSMLPMVERAAGYTRSLGGSSKTCGGGTAQAVKHRRHHQRTDHQGP